MHNKDTYLAVINCFLAVEQSNYTKILRQSGAHVLNKVSCREIIRTSSNKHANKSPFVKSSLAVLLKCVFPGKN